MKIYIGADHAGLALKENIKKILDKAGIPYRDLGNKKFDKNDDYPAFAKKVARKVAREKEKGILVCASGVGMCIAANKIKGIRAANALSEKIAEMSRRHNDTNIICLGGEYITPALAKKIIMKWIKTKPDKAKRHIRRIEQIEK